MRFTIIGAVSLIAAAAPAYASAATAPGQGSAGQNLAVQGPSTQGPAAQAPDSGQTTPAVPPSVVPERRADGSVPSNGVVRPAPDATRDATVRPPNVDPAMTIPPPGTPGSDVKVNPK